MELVPGEPLSAVIEREHTLSIDKVLDIVAQTSAALQAAHAAGLVHRDIKPGNMLITPEGRVKITDFGIARIADQVPLTATGQVMGTVQYLSPEQASGHPASPSTDIYSLGIVAYECLAGRRPFTGESQVAIAMAQINDTAPPLSDTIAEPVRNLVFSCISKKPSERPASAANLARAAQALRRGDLQGAALAVPAVLGGVPVSDATMVMPRTQDTAATTVFTVPPTTAAVDLETKKRSPWTWPLIALIGVLVLVLAGAVFALVSGGSPTPAPTTTSAGPSQSGTPSSSPSRTSSSTPTPTTAAIVEGDYIGKPYDTVSAELSALGMNVNRVEGTAALDPATVGFVYGVTPTGPTVAKGSTIAVKVYGPVPVVAAPGSAPMLDGSTTTTAKPGDTVVISWPAYSQCPSGSVVSGYSIFVDGASVGTVAGSVTSFNYTVPGPADVEKDHPVTYQVGCGPLQSGISPAATLTVNLLGI
jgi:cytoskeletal protein RodZ